MRLFWRGKDGGPESTVTGYWLVEWKMVCSIVLLRFDNGTRETFHSHAFNSVSWVLKGALFEEMLSGEELTHLPGLNPVITKRTTFHRVRSLGISWVISFRGPWAKTWGEYIPGSGESITLTNGRKVL